MSNNVLVIPGADFSDSAVENVFIPLNPNFTEVNSEYKQGFDFYRKWVLPCSLFQGHPLAKIRGYVGGPAVNNEAGIGDIATLGIGKISASFGEAVNNSMVEDLFTITAEVTEEQVFMDLIFPRTINLSTNEFLVLSYTIPVLYWFSKSAGLLGLPADGSNINMPSASQNNNSVQLYYID